MLLSGTPLLNPGNQTKRSINKIPQLHFFRKKLGTISIIPRGGGGFNLVNVQGFHKRYSARNAGFGF